MNFFAHFLGDRTDPQRARIAQEAEEGKRLLCWMCANGRVSFGPHRWAILIPLGELDRRVKEVPKAARLSVICASGHRSVPQWQVDGRDILQ